jgi:hypothetical protein
MSKLFCIFFLLIATTASAQELTLTKIPTDLKESGLTPFFDPDEILRVWTGYEGGTSFDELFEFVRVGNNWTITQFTYLHNEFRKYKSEQKIRKKVVLTGELLDNVTQYVNSKLLYANVNDKRNQMCLCSIFQVEYRLEDQSNIFRFDYEEQHNINPTKIALKKALKPHLSW